MEKNIYEPYDLAGIRLKNRIIRSATHEGMADEKGFPTEKLADLYRKLAQGEAGAIITGFAGVQKNGKSHVYRMLMVDDDACIEKFAGVVRAAHEYGTPVILQIAHCGRQTRSRATGEKTVAPSAIKDKFFDEDIPQALTDHEIREIINNFVLAIERAKKAGFDGVELNAAHGWLLSEFLSPRTNRRHDDWGGTTENRFRIIAEIMKKAKEKVGDYPVLVKINGHEGKKSGIKIEEAVRIARLLEASGCAAIEVSCGLLEDGFYVVRGQVPTDAIVTFVYKFKKIPAFLRPFAKRLVPLLFPVIRPLTQYNVAAAEAIKKNVSLPVIVVGGIPSRDAVSDIIDNNKADLVTMARPFIIEPDIVKKYREGKQRESRCIYCNYCFVATETHPLRCYHGKL